MTRQIVWSDTLESEARADDAPTGSVTVKTYRRHACARNHRSYFTLAKCIWGRRAAWIEGEGPYALLAWCRTLTVSLHPTLAAALSDKALLDSSGCGGACCRRHEIVRLIHV